jgi:hypothetical protein
VVITTDHTCFDLDRIIRSSALVIDTRNTTRGWVADHLIGLSGSPRQALPREAGAAVAVRR